MGKSTTGRFGGFVVVQADTTVVWVRQYSEDGKKRMKFKFVCYSPNDGGE